MKRIPIILLNSTTQQNQNPFGYKVKFSPVQPNKYVN